MLVVLRIREGESARARYRKLIHLIDRQLGKDMTRFAADDSWMIWGQAGRTFVTLSADQHMVILGDLFDPVGDRLSSAGLDRRLAGVGRLPVQRASLLCEQAWGRYLALFCDPATCCPTHAMRDPMGSMTVQAAAADGVVLLASSWPSWLCAAASLDLSVDDAIVAALLADPTVPLATSALRGTEALLPGALHALDARHPSLRLWSPVDIAGSSARRSMSVAEAGLREAVETACRAWAGGRSRIGLQLSGGLDSAIVLAGLKASAPAATITAINLSVRDREGDERDHARSAANRHGIALVEHQLLPEAMDLAQLTPAVGLSGPRLFGLDVQQERILAAFAEEAGAEAMMTGQGGDAVFFQMPYPEMVIDHRRSVGVGAYLSGFPWTIARRAHCSIWRLWAMMLSDQLGRRHRRLSVGAYGGSLLTPHARALIGDQPPRHPWLDGAAELAPGKQRQLESIIGALVYLTPSARGRVTPVIHPLLSQPVVEYCLSLPVFQLSMDDRDRSLARDAFRDRLPAMIATRTGKGESSRYANRALVANLGFLRRYLLDGALVQRDLLDPACLSAMLDEDYLMTAPHGRVLVFYAAVEAWLRRWA